MVVDTKTWKIKKEIQNIGPDMQTLAITYDGKYVIGVSSGSPAVLRSSMPKPTSWLASGRATAAITTG
jgi:hypothetical protein